MATAVHFSVVDKLPEPVQENVLVFLMPLGASDDYQFAAWQSLNIGPGGSQPFTFIIDLAVQAVDMTDGSASAQVAVNPGQVLEVVYENVRGLKLQPSEEKGRITPKQVGVINKLEQEPRLIETHWFVNGQPCCAIPKLNLDAIQTFELQPNLYFYAAIPTVRGFNYRLQQVSEQTKYTVPASASDVTVEWTRPGGVAGADTFTFHPPAPAPLDAGEAASDISQFFAEVRGYQAPGDSRRHRPAR